jgi:hypothetical protein
MDHLAVLVVFATNNLFLSNLFIASTADLNASKYSIIEQVSIDDSVANPYIKEAIALAVLDQIRLISTKKKSNTQETKDFSFLRSFIQSIYKYDVISLPLPYIMPEDGFNYVNTDVRDSYHSYFDLKTPSLSDVHMRTRKMRPCAVQSILNFSENAPLALTTSFFSSLPDIKLRTNEDRLQYAKGDAILSDYEGKHRTLTNSYYRIREAKELFDEAGNNLFNARRSLEATNHRLSLLNTETLKDVVDFQLIQEKKLSYEQQRVSIASDMNTFHKITLEFRQEMSSLQAKIKALEDDFRQLKRVDFDM